MASHTVYCVGFLLGETEAVRLECTVPDSVTRKGVSLQVVPGRAADNGASRLAIDAAFESGSYPVGKAFFQGPLRTDVSSRLFRNALGLQP
jgi:hypothetical protein